MANNTNLSYPSAFCQQFFDKNGKPLVGGKLYTYIAGSPTPVVTYKTISGGTESANMNTNPIILDMAGMAELVISTDTAYKFVLFDRNDVKIATWDNVTAGGSEGGGSSEEIVVEGTTDEINVTSNITQGVKHYVVSLSNTIKSAILRLLGLYENVVISLEGKADKVQGGTTGNLAALDAEGNLTDSGSKVSDFKTKQTAVSDPSASGTGLAFIDSISQNANGEITTHKKSVQDGTTAQKGVIQLQDSVGATESTTDKAVTPHAVREAIDSAVASAYHAAGAKTVAQLTSALLVSTNEGCVYNVTDSGTTTADFIEGSGHHINAGDNVGVCNVGGGVYKFDLLSGFVDLSNYLTKTGDGKDLTSTFTKASGDTSSLTSGSKLSVLFTAISSFFGTLKALAFKDNVSDSDISGTISDNHIASASAWNAKQNALPTSGTASSTFAINISGNAEIANYLKRAYVNKSSQTTKIWKKIATSKTFTNYDAGSICFLYNHSGYIDEKGLDSIVSISIHAGNAGSLVAARIDTYSYRSESETQLLKIGITNQYEVWVKVPTSDTNMYATLLNSYNDWTINTDVSQTGQLTDDEFTAYKLSNPSVGTDYNYNVVKASKIGVGSTRLPIFANSDGILSPMNIDEYYCWAEPTAQWTDVMEMGVWYVQNQCNNEILGSIRSIKLNSSHPSLCYLRVKLPELQGAGRYRFTLEFEIKNTDGQQSDNAYGVLILVPPTGYSGESFLAECAYDSNGVPQSFLLNQFHVPRQGQTYRHKLYVDGHTYRVVKTK